MIKLGKPATFGNVKVGNTLLFHYRDGRIEHWKVTSVPQYPEGYFHFIKVVENGKHSKIGAPGDCRLGSGWFHLPTTRKKYAKELD